MPTLCKRQTSNIIAVIRYAPLAKPDFKSHEVEKFTDDAFSKKPGRQPGLRRTLKFKAGQSAQAAWLNALVTPVLRGSAVASVTFWANAASSLVCSVSVSNCSCECSVDNLMNSEGDFTPKSFWAKVKAASVLALANSMTLVLYSCAPCSGRRIAVLDQRSSFSRGSAHLLEGFLGLRGAVYGFGCWVQHGNYP
jgi:hypothetical protein